MEIRTIGKCDSYQILSDFELVPYEFECPFLTPESERLTSPFSLHA